MYDFNFARPTSLADASAKMKAAGDDGVFLAGGQTLIPALKLRLRRPSAVIDIGALEGLQGIVRKGDVLSIGALATHAAVAQSTGVREAIAALADLAGGIGDPQVRHRGTIGGSVANADPAADYPAGVVALNADVVTDRRTIAADKFFTGMFETTLNPGEIVTAVNFRVPDKAAYMKFPNPASRYALVGVFVARFGKDVRVAVTGAGPCVFRVRALEQALAKSFSADAATAIKIPATDLNSDIHAAADYRAHLITVMAARAVAACT